MKERLLQLSRRRFHLPQADLIKTAISHLSFVEKVIFYGFVTFCVGSTLFIINAISDYVSVEVPVRGGSLTEGVIGSPRFINPLLAISDTDRDLTTLVYAGLLKATPIGGLEPDLAESYSISEDGLTYTFTLKPNLTFHDGEPLTTDDVEFTILKSQDPVIKSPKRANWDSVATEKTDERTIIMRLRQPYAPFLENATIGILPKHLWKNVSSEEFALSFLNIEPIGAGPYAVNSIQRNSSGIPESYELRPFGEYALGEPYITKLTFTFFQNEQGLLDALKAGTINAINSIPPERLESLNLEDSTVLHTPLPRIFGVFFNQNQAPVFADKDVREALNEAVDKERLITEILSGFGVVAEGPLPPGILRRVPMNATTTTPEERIANARAKLLKAGWKFNEKEGVLEKKTKQETRRLSFSLTTSNASELKKIAYILKDSWEAMGAKVDVKIFETGDLNQNIIRPRRYDALLFGEVIGRDLDLFAFWHSSQRNDPGLNIALYTNIKADKILSDARAIPERKQRIEKYEQFVEEMTKDTPAIFLYSPEFIYIVPKKLKGVDIDRMTVPSERFLTIEDWYTETEKVWNIFTNRSNETY